MTIRTQRRLYWTTAAALLAATAVVWVDFTRSMKTQTAASSPDTVSPVGQTNASAPASASLPSLRDFRPYLNRSLRAPLYDPPPPPPPVVQPPPPLRLKLLGTVVEGERSEAILITAAGNVEMHRVGATVDNAVIQGINAGSIDVLYHDQTLTLTPAPGN